VRARLQPPLPVLLARGEVRRHGSGAAGRGAVDRLPAVRGVQGPAVRRGGRQADARAGRGTDRERVPGTGQQRAGSTTTASSTRATPATCWGCACRSRTTRRSRAPAATACGGH
jgi:hypothetical protein